ncbi:hypothetical protein [Burkholderia stagnalis]|uniref:hypothetical protein n=1 Tax=Burkholderia stagnalis TaxID=1503054 RepID=UPI0012DA34BE|nr:hypothetical protein [Burkholderia stagnalis]
MPASLAQETSRQRDVKYRNQPRKADTQNNMFCRFLNWLAQRGRHTTLHVAVITLLSTAGFIMFTAGDLGPMAPLVIAIAFYLIFAAVAAEMALGVATVIRYLARRAIRRAA